MCRRNYRDRHTCLTIVGCLLGVSGIVSIVFWHQIFDKILQMQLILRPDAVYYEHWKNPSDPVNINVYLYNWTNPEDFGNHSIKPIVKQCGPYSFTEKPEKVDIKWHSNNDSVSYRKKSFYYFDAAHSRGSLDDEIIALNVVAMSAASKTKELNVAQSNMVSMGLDLFDQRRHVVKTVDELLLSGYSDNIIVLASSIPIFGNVKMPDRFGWFYGNNGTAGILGVFNIHTGAKSASTRGQLHAWDYSNHTGFYDSYCGMVNGSAGELYPANLTPDSVIYVFVPELCRSVPLEYTETVKVEGITGYKYATGLRFVDNGTIYPENACYCGRKCYPSGILDVSNCRLNAPLFTSLPHFYQADPYYLNLVDGMEPNKNLHEFYVIVEPKTGATLEVVARLQINILVEPVDDVRLFKNVPRVFFPLIWMESRFRIGSLIVDEMNIIPYALWGGYVLASVVFAIGLIILIWNPAQQLCSHEKKYKSDIANRQVAPEYKSRRILRIQSKKSDTPGNDQSPADTLLLQVNSKCNDG